MLSAVYHDQKKPSLAAGHAQCMVERSPQGQSRAPIGYVFRLQASRRARRVELDLLGGLPQYRRLVTPEPHSLAVFAITPISVSLIDYAQGFCRSFLREL